VSRRSYNVFFLNNQILGRRECHSSLNGFSQRADSLNNMVRVVFVRRDFLNTYECSDNFGLAEPKHFSVTAKYVVSIVYDCFRLTNTSLLSDSALSKKTFNGLTHSLRPNDLNKKSSRPTIPDCHYQIASFFCHHQIAS